MRTTSHPRANSRLKELLLSAGVKVRKGQEEVEVLAPVVVSNCGVFTTFQKLLPPEVSVRTGERPVLVRCGVRRLQTHAAPPATSRRPGEAEDDAARPRLLPGLLWL